MRLNKIIIATAACLSFASCNKDDGGSEPQRTTDAVSVDFAAGSSKRTRSNPIVFSDNGDGTTNATAETAFNAGDKVCVSVPGQKPVTYILGGDGKWTETGSDFLRWKSATMNFSAYYPVSEGTSLTSFTLPTDQSENLANADYMVVSEEPITHAQNSAAISLTLQRQTARVIVNIVGFQDSYIADPLAVSDLQIVSGADAIGGSTPTAVTPYEHGGTGGIGTKYVALVIPTAAKTAEPFITLTDPLGNPLTFTGIPAMEAGNSYTYNLTIGKNSIKISSVTVEDWNSGGAMPTNQEAIAHVQKVEIEEQPLYVGTKFTLNAIITPFNATNSMVTWESSNSEVASINAYGEVTIKDNTVGEVVTFTLTSEENSELTDTYTTTILAPKGYVYLGVDYGGKQLYWAEKNLGATVPEDFGNYYAWGEIEPKGYYDYTTYVHCNKNWEKLTKYCNDAAWGNDGYTDTYTVLLPEDDAATVYDPKSSIPIEDEWQALIEGCDWEKVGDFTSGSQSGYKVKSKTNDNVYIFLPAAGYMEGSSQRTGFCGIYWSSSLSWITSGVSLLIDSDNVRTEGTDRRYGLSVRSVRRGN